MTKKPNPSITSFLAPLRHERLWLTVLWALALAAGAAGLDLAERRLADAAARETIVLLPDGAPSEEQRTALRRDLAAEPGVGSVQWRSPADLTRKVVGRFPQSEWQNLFPDDEVWLPWVLEVRPADPLGQLAVARAFVSRRAQETGRWRLTLWDDARLAELASTRRQARVVAGLWLALVAAAGAAALSRLVWPERGGVALAFWSALLGALAPAAVWAGAMAAGQPLEPRTLAVVAGTGFILATIIAPMLRLRGSQSLSLTLSEDDHEREWQSSSRSE